MIRKSLIATSAALIAFAIAGIPPSVAAPRTGKCFLHNHTDYSYQVTFPDRKPKKSECRKTTESGMDGSLYELTRAKVMPLGDENWHVLTCWYKLVSYYGTPVCPECYEATCRGLCKEGDPCLSNRVCTTKKQCLSGNYTYRTLR